MLPGFALFCDECGELQPTSKHPRPFSTNRRLFLVGALATAGALATGIYLAGKASPETVTQTLTETREVVTTVRSAEALVAPLPLSPASDSVFNTYPRTTTLQWGSVPGAASYSVEIDCHDCCVAGQWCTDVGKQWDIVRNVYATSYTFNWVGANQGRWRVWAVGSSGQEGPKSDWWYFTYTV